MSVIAFIPVRGGSKSIPLKNIKPFCGKPLVLWNIEALERCPEVDEIVVATDSIEIWDTVKRQYYKKVRLYQRSAENACDTASTESVMLEYIKYTCLSPEHVFMLVQATSPLTQTIHFSEALQMYASSQYDSILSCVRTYRFFWKEDGESLNYDYKHRPRRQDFQGMLMENGAFYINTVKNIIASKNRLCGRIGVYIMPEYAAAEIDEPDDWAILENLMQRHVLRKKPNSIKLFVTDIDGTMTDGGMYYSENGDELKKFNTRDGMAIEMLKGKGIKTGIITSENCTLNLRRAQKLKFDFIIQGSKFLGKLEAVRKIVAEMGISMQEVAYIGDDINCYDLLNNVGVAACPNDACKHVREIPGIKIMSRRGGDACVREFVEWIIG